MYTYHCQYAPYTLHFAFQALTSRGALPIKPTWFVRMWDEENPDVVGYGEIPLFPGLSAESTNDDDFEAQIRQVLARVNSGEFNPLEDFAQETDPTTVGVPSSIRFGVECAGFDLVNHETGYDWNQWIEGEKPNIINGLIWMGDFQTMLERIKTKLDEGFECLKLKIGGIDFDSECQLLQMIRSKFSKDSLTLRLDANGSFTPENAMERLERLSKFDIHSIEQPIRQGQWSEMRRLCENSPIAIALDEELIGLHSDQQKRQMLSEIRPQYIILKPSLCGGITQSYSWWDIAVEEFDIAPWYTSALETNVGLRAIAQVAYTRQDEYDLWMPQGLGTGQVFTNNVLSGIYLKGQELWYDPKKDFDLSGLDLNWIEP